MTRVHEPPLPFSRLLELAEQAGRQGRCRFTPFLTPPEAELALAAAKRANVSVELSGGYPDAERRMARFCETFATPEPFPIQTLSVTWPHQDAPGHRDLLGALMALGIQRAKIGDIALAPEQAYLFVESTLAGMVAQALTEAGRVRLTVCETDMPPETGETDGEEQRFTVQSLRLDAVIADGFHLSRSDASSLIEAGGVKLRHTPTLRPDARVDVGDAISVRGYGRLRIDFVGEPTRTGRLPVTLTRFGTARR